MSDIVIRSGLYREWCVRPFHDVRRSLERFAGEVAVTLPDLIPERTFWEAHPQRNGDTIVIAWLFRAPSAAIDRGGICA